MADLKAALKLVKGAGITIPKKEFVKEHKKLVGVLTKGTKKQRLAEAKDQAKELALKGSLAGSGFGDLITSAVMSVVQPYLDAPVQKLVEFALKQIYKYATGEDFPPQTYGELAFSIVKPYLGAAAGAVFAKIKDAIKDVYKFHGGSQKSGFIQRMMAEVKKKHDGEYKNPTKPLAADTEMNAPVAFDYFMMPKESREMSKFIMDHFLKIRPYRAGERAELNEYELKKLRDAEAERQRRSRARRRAV